MDEKRQYELIEKLTEIVNELGWVIGIPTADVVPGLIIGTEDFVREIIQDHYGLDENEYVSLTEDPTGESSMVEIPIDPTKKPKTYH